MEYNIYCDESCHLEHDGINIMALGAIWCDKEKKSEIFNRIRGIKVECGLSRTFEIKWNKVSPSKKDFYLRLVDYFFADDDTKNKKIILCKKNRTLPILNLTIIIGKSPAFILVNRLLFVISDRIVG